MIIFKTEFRACYFARQSCRLRLKESKDSACICSLISVNSKFEKKTTGMRNDWHRRAKSFRDAEQRLSLLPPYGLRRENHRGKMYRKDDSEKNKCTSNNWTYSFCRSMAVFTNQNISVATKRGYKHVSLFVKLHEFHNSPKRAELVTILYGNEATKASKT